MNVIFVNRFYWPETAATAQLLTDLAESLASQGHSVSIVTSRGGKGLRFREQHHDVTIHRVPTTRWKRAGALGHAVDFLTFYAFAMGKLFRYARQGSLVIAMTDPPLLGVGAWLVSLCRGTRLVHWVQDIYPEIAMQVTGQRWLALLRPLRDRAWRGADNCVTLGHDMAGVLLKAGVLKSRIRIIPNWAPRGLWPRSGGAGNALRREWHLDDAFVVGYSGNLGRVHQLDPVLALAEAVRDDPKIVFVFIGDGAERASLERTARVRGLSNVRFYPAQPREQLGETLGLPDVHLVTLRDGCESLVFPSKLYGIAAVQRPIIFIGPTSSEVARTVIEGGFGWAVPGGAAAHLAPLLRQLAREPHTVAGYAAATAAFSASHDSSRALAAWIALLSLLDACAEPGRADNRVTKR